MKSYPDWITDVNNEMYGEYRLLNFFNGFEQHKYKISHY